MAAPTLAAGQYDGQTRVLQAANNLLGQFFNALAGPDNVHNGQQDLASLFFQAGAPAGYTVTQPQMLRDLSPIQFSGQPTQMWDRYVIIAHAVNFNTKGSYIGISTTRYNLAGEAGQCISWLNVNDSQTSGMYADLPWVGMSGNALLIAANLYSFNDNSFQYAKMWMIPKTAVYNDPSSGTCPAFSASTLVLNMPNSDGSLPFSVIPAKSYDTAPTAYMVNSLLNGGSALTVWQLDTTDPTNITGSYGTVSTNPYSAPPNAEQPGRSALIITWDTRLFNAVYQPGSGL